MARIRTIKPGFWKDEQLSELPEPSLILAAGLLNVSDDEGFFNANPRLLKAELSPLREPSVTIHDSLSALARVKYIKLGKGDDGRRYGQVVNFLKHQRVNRPQPSKISTLNIVWEDAPVVHGALIEPSLPEGKGCGSGIGRGNGRDRDNDVAGSPDLSLISTSDADDDLLPISFDRRDEGVAVRAWNGIASRCGLSRVQNLTKVREISLKRRLSDCGGLPGWLFALEKVQNNTWMHGNNDRGWKIDFDFLLRPEKFSKLMEGAYDGKSVSKREGGLATLLAEAEQESLLGSR